MARLMARPLLPCRFASRCLLGRVFSRLRTRSRSRPRMSRCEGSETGVVVTRKRQC